MLRIARRILQIHSDRAGGQYVARRACGIFRTIAISRFHVGRNRNLDRRRNAADNRQHLLARNALSIGISQA